jgi:CO/xanthine dehydrogenase Mo-binding subunit
MDPGHPYGAKGVAEVNICPPMAAIANAIERAVGVRLTELPMSPPKVLAAIDARAKVEKGSRTVDAAVPSP